MLAFEHAHKFLKKSWPVWKRCLSHLESNSWSIPEGYNTGISVYNSMTKCKVPLVLTRGQILSWYMCGPTVYDDAHIGHASCYVKFDIIRRILENFFDINVIQLMGITDIDDKIIARSREKGLEFWQLARAYERDFFKDLANLNVLPPTTSLRVTDMIPPVIAFISRILDQQLAYVTGDGSVYFDLTKYGLRYGKLMPATLSDETDTNVQKKNPMDFALWKAAKKNEPWWESPWGKGRPGWHIECSTMASQMFGSQLDMHSGGIDLIFPHHENELAQSRAYHNVPQWVNYWLHTGHVHLKAEKMSKSLKNVITIQDFLLKHTQNEFRIFCLRSHYRNNMEYTEVILEEATVLFHKFQTFLGQVKAYVQGQLQCATLDQTDLSKRLDDSASQVKQALADDFDTNRALETILTLMTHVNKAFLNKEVTAVRDPALIAAIGNYINKFLNNLGIDLQTNQKLDYIHLESIVESTVKFRQDMRILAIQPKSDFDSDDARKTMLGACDRLRKELGVIGVIVKDQGKESYWTIELPNTKTTKK